MHLFVSLQSVNLKKFFEKEEDCLKDLLRRKELQAKHKMEAGEVSKKTVSCGFWLQKEETGFVQTLKVTKSTAVNLFTKDNNRGRIQ